MGLKHKLLHGAAVVAVATAAMPASAETFEVGQGTASLMGYLSQGLTYGLRDEPDTEKGLNSAMTTLLLEGDYRPNDQIKVFGSMMLTGDWIYDLKNDDDSWNRKGFQSSRDQLQFDDEYWQILKEFHVTYTPSNFLFRVGKQIVKWGEMDGQAIMDQVNPIDRRRGPAEVEIETQMIPIWLVRSEYYPDFSNRLVQDLGLEFVFNPNADFIPTADAQLGNQNGGPFAPRIPGPLFKNIPGFGPGGGPLLLPSDAVAGVAAGIPFPPAAAAFLAAAAGAPELSSRLGTITSMNIPTPDAWDEDGFEYALRLKGNVGDSLVTFNYFYGRENLPVTRGVPGAMPVPSISPSGDVELNTQVEGFYPRLHFAGGTLSRDLTFLKSSALGGVSPILRLEALYAFDSTFTATRAVATPFGPGQVQSFEKSDEVRAGIGIDWKVKLDWLNEREGIMISPQYFYQKMLDRPGDVLMYQAAGGANMFETNQQASLLLSTRYMNSKLAPQLLWLHDITNEADWFRAAVTYDWTDTWRTAIGAQIFHGSEPGAGFDVFDSKDYIFFKVTYTFG